MGRRWRWGRRHGPTGSSRGTNLGRGRLRLLLLRLPLAALVLGPLLLLLDGHLLVMTLTLGGRSGTNVIANGTPISASILLNGLVE